MSVGVIIASVIIFFKEEWKVADPICTYVFSVIVCFTVSKVVKSCVMVLMEGAPEKMDLKKLMNQVDQLENVADIHDFHVWSISLGKTAMSAHIKCKANPM